MKKTPLKKSGKFKWSRLSPVAKRKMKGRKEYYERARAFLKDHPFCQIWLKEYSIPEDQAIAQKGWVQIAEPQADGAVVYKWAACPRSDDVHHMAGRLGLSPNGIPLLIDEAYWMASSRQMHDFVHRFPRLAEEKGYIVRLPFKPNG